ncbi:MAG TPA: hypothetical protein VMJ66_10425 [Geobacteraceae bacterium]|nr:hypothetical protein [Geobacteraceae bacterium]
MKKILIIAAVVVAGATQTALAGNVGVGVDIHIGNQPPVVPAPVPVYAPPPPPPPQPVVIEEPPLFLYPPELGFGVAVGLPYDVFYISGAYYLCRGNVWYRAPYYNGPWAVTRYRSLPPGLRRHGFEQIHYYRDRDYRDYRAGIDHYHGRYYRPDKRVHEAMKEHRKEEHERWKEEKHWDKEERGHDEGHGRHGD